MSPPSSEGERVGAEVVVSVSHWDRLLSDDGEGCSVLTGQGLAGSVTEEESLSSCFRTTSFVYHVAVLSNADLDCCGRNAPLQRVEAFELSFFSDLRSGILSVAIPVLVKVWVCFTPSPAPDLRGVLGTECALEEEGFPTSFSLSLAFQNSMDLNFLSDMMDEQASSV